MRPVLSCALALLAAPLSAQSLLYRSPNLGGTWTPDGGVVQFNFVHRFYVAPAASGHKVTNFPTFTVAAGLGQRIAVGVHYGSNSLVSLSPYHPNEAEVYARYRVVGATAGVPGLAVAVTPAYNSAAQSADGELSVDYTRGSFTLSGAVRGMSHPLRNPDPRAALAAGAVWRLTDYVALSADVGSLLGPTTRAAWSAALAFVIPSSPHTFSLQASNATTSTIEGNSKGFTKILYGFEFTIPLHLSRFRPWFHRPERVVRINQPLMNAAAAAEVVIEGLRFGSDTVTVSAGQIVKWVNRDNFEHTVTFNAPDAAHLSGALSPKGELAIRFDQPGTYPYHCLPHPTMKGVVVVK
jgi:plastocyanin